MGEECHDGFLESIFGSFFFFPLCTDWAHPLSEIISPKPDTAIEPNVQNGPSPAADGSADNEEDEEDECMSDRWEGSERPQTPLSRVAWARAICEETRNARKNE